jgi:hypothetical protein
MNAESIITLIEPVSIRVGFDSTSKTVTLVRFSTSRDPGWEHITLPADYLVRVIAPAVEAHLRKISNPPSCLKSGAAPASSAPPCPPPKPPAP